MKIVVIGGSGLIGKKLAPILQKQGHEAVVASRSSGVDVLTGKKTETTVVTCQPNDPCPAEKHITQKVALPHP